MCGILLLGVPPPPPYRRPEETSWKHLIYFKQTPTLLLVCGVPVRDGIPVVNAVFSVHHYFSLTFSTVSAQLEWQSPQPLLMASHGMIYSPSGLSLPGRHPPALKVNTKSNKNIQLIFSLFISKQTSQSCMLLVITAGHWGHLDFYFIYLFRFCIHVRCSAQWLHILGSTFSHTTRSAIFSAQWSTFSLAAQILSDSQDCL